MSPKGEEARPPGRMVSRTGPPMSAGGAKRPNRQTEKNHGH
jgi:hypothetical protein